MKILGDPLLERYNEGSTISLDIVEPATGTDASVGYLVSERNFVGAPSFNMVMESTALIRSDASVGDNALVTEYLGGCDQAFEFLVHRYQDRLVNYINGIIRDYDRAIDLSQDTFIRVFRNAHRYEGKYQFSTWLYRIATNLAIDELRRRERKGRFFFYNVLDFFQSEGRTVPLPDSRNCPERTLDTKEKAQHLQTAIDSLSEKYRLPFILKEVQGLSYEETSQVLNISLGTVKSRIHRAKMLLRERLTGVL